MISLPSSAPMALPPKLRVAMAVVTYDAPRVCGAADISAAGSYLVALICTACHPPYESGPLSVAAESAEMARERVMRRHAEEVHGWLPSLLTS